MNNLKKRVILTRPAVPVHRPVTPPPPAPTTRAHAAEHTTTTNVVSVVCEAVRERAHANTHASNADNLLDQFKTLSSKDRKAVLDSLLLEAQLSGETDAGRDLDMWAEAVHRELTRRLGSLDGGIVGPGVVRKLVAVGTSWKPVEQFMQASKLSTLTVTERQRAYYMLAELLVRHALVVARRSGAPMSAKLVANCTNNLPGVFEESFPGYLEAGLARMVTRHAERA